MSDGVQEQAVELAEVKAGVKLEAGHPVVLVVNGLHGTRPPDSAGSAATTEDSAAKSETVEPDAPGAVAAKKDERAEPGSAAAQAAAGAQPDAARAEQAGDDLPGQISLRLLDASGTVPLADKEVTLDLGAAGKVTAKTDAGGKVSHPGVAIQDYELSIGEARVMIPAIPKGDQVHDQVIPGIKFGFVKLAIRDAAGDPLALADIELEGPEKVSGKTDANGNFARAGPLPPGEITVRAGQASAKIQLPASPWATTIVRLQ